MVYSTHKKEDIIGEIEKIAYTLVLNNKNYVFVSMDPFTKDLNKIRVPTAATQAVFQQKVKKCLLNPMVFVIPKNRDFLMARVGDISLIAGIKRYEFIDGKAKGLEAIDIKTGSGFNFTVLPGRGMGRR